MNARSQSLDVVGRPLPIPCRKFFGILVLSGVDTHAPIYSERAVQVKGKSDWLRRSPCAVL